MLSMVSRLNDKMVDVWYERARLGEAFVIVL
jgi:hypothetical protein